MKNKKWKWVGTSHQKKVKKLMERNRILSQEFTNPHFMQMWLRGLLNSRHGGLLISLERDLNNESEFKNISKNWIPKINFEITLIKRSELKKKK